MLEEILRNADFGKIFHTLDQSLFTPVFKKPGFGKKTCKMDNYFVTRSVVLHCK